MRLPRAAPSAVGKPADPSDSKVLSPALTAIEPAAELVMVAEAADGCDGGNADGAARARFAMEAADIIAVTSSTDAEERGEARPLLRADDDDACPDSTDAAGDEHACSDPTDMTAEDTAFSVEPP